MHALNACKGRYGEEIARNYLVGIGYTIIENNYRCKIGEIDIIAKDNEYITFVEVKTRCGNLYGYPSESITRTKQHKIYKTALQYVQLKKLYYSDLRFDVIEVIINQNNFKPSVKLIKNAFQI